MGLHFIFSGAADGQPGVISHLQYATPDPVRFRECTVTILKSRASAHDPEIREFEITPEGIVLGDAIAGQAAGAG